MSVHAVALLWLLAWCRSASAQADAGPAPGDAAATAPSTARGAPVDPTLAEAKRLFEQGNALRRTGEWQRALDFFLESRRLRASVPNTINAAVCLEQLGRFDEALELYESILVDLTADIDDALRDRLKPKLAALRARIGFVELSANVSGKVVIDGRERGQLPLGGPLRVLPGRRLLRVIADGYASYERDVEITAKQTLRLDARLAALAASGRLRVEVTNAVAAEVRVDGVSVGHAPWEGTLAPGRHVYEVLHEDRGSGPVAAVVLQGQTALARPMLAPLGAALRIAAEPASAELDVDGVVLGKTPWQGRLTRGRHVVGAREAGYRTLLRAVEVQADQPRSLDLTLSVDPDHPRWGTHARSELWLDGFAALALAPSLGSSAEQSCDAGRCSASGTPLGFVGGARFGWQLPLGLSLEAAAGYAAVGVAVERSDDVPFGAGTASYAYRDDVRVAGPLVSAGARWSFALGARFSVHARAHVGAWLVAARDVASATVSNGTSFADAPVAGVSEATRSIALTVLPELALVGRWSRFHAGVGVLGLIVPGKGPANAQGDANPTLPGTDCSPTPAPVACARASGLLHGERGYGPLLVVAPGAQAGWIF